MYLSRVKNKEITQFLLGFGRRILFNHPSMKRRKPSIKDACSALLDGVYMSHVGEPSEILRVAVLCRGNRNIRNRQYFSALSQNMRINII